MAISSGIDAKTIDQLQELGKLTGSEKTIVTDGKNTKKVSIDTIIGYAASKLSNIQSSGSSASSNPGVSSFLGENQLTFVPNGSSISISERTPGGFYLEETNQVSIRTQINLPTSVTVNRNLGLRRE